MMLSLLVSMVITIAIEYGRVRMTGKLIASWDRNTCMFNVRKILHDLVEWTEVMSEEELLDEVAMGWEIEHE